jgi:hypothetical protein
VRSMARWVAATVGTGMVGTALVAGAQAADAPGSASHRDELLPLEIVGFGALAVGGRFKVQGGGADDSGTGDRVNLTEHGAFALAADLRADEGRQYELFYSREATDLPVTRSAPRTQVTVEYLQLGGTVLLNDAVLIKPYAVGGLGVARLSPGDEGSTDTRFSASLGLGLRWPVTRQLSLRFEGRAFVTLVNDSTAIFCRSDDSGLLCRIHGNGQTFVQGEFLAGVAFAF